LKIKPRRYLWQLVARRSVAYRRQLAKLGQAVDRSEWVMNAQLVNAVNLPADECHQFPRREAAAAVL